MFLEIGWVKFFCHLPANTVKCVSEYIFVSKKRIHTKKVKETKEEKRKTKETKEGKELLLLWTVSEESLILIANLLCVLLTYVIESWISPGCSYEFNEVYVQQEKSQYLLHYNNIEVQALKWWLDIGQHLTKIRNCPTNVWDKIKCPTRLCFCPTKNWRYLTKRLILSNKYLLIEFFLQKPLYRKTL